MITEHDLQEAIAECKGERNPNARTCIKLASFLIIQRELFGQPDNDYSFSLQPGAISYQGESEFAERINGMDSDTVFAVFDELMDMLKVLHPKIYDSVMRRL